MKLTIVGSVALDDVKTPYGERRNALGGSVTYASLAASFFCQPNIVGVVGQDFPEAFIELFKKKKINTGGLEVKKGKTFHWGGEYSDLNKALTIFTDLNVFAEFSPVLPQSYRDSEIIFLGNIDPVLQLNVLGQMSSSRIVALDTMNFWISSKRDELLKVLKKVDILFMNDDEFKQLTCCSNIYQACDRVREMGPEILVVKRGEYGAMIFGEGLHFYTPVFPVMEVRDPTGAGDSFAGSFLGYLASCGSMDHANLKNAMLYATAVASFTVSSFSVESLIEASMDEVVKRKKEVGRLIDFS